MRRTIVMFMIGCAIPFLGVGCGGGDAASEGGDAVAQGEGGGGEAGMPPGGDSGESMPGGGMSMPGGEGDGIPGGEGDAMPGGEGDGIPGDEGDAVPGGEGDAVPGDGVPGLDGVPGDAPPGGQGSFEGAPGFPGGATGAPGGDPGYPGGGPPGGNEGDPMGDDPAADGFAGPPGGPGGAIGPPGADGVPGYAQGGGDPAGGDPAGGGAFAGAPGGEGIPGTPGGEGYPGGGAPGGEGVPGGIGPGGGGRAAPPSGFDGAAQVAFQSGKESEAFKYLYAHALSSAAGGADLLTSIQWVKALKRPALAVRFGAGVALKGPPNITDVKPIGSTQKLPERGSRSRGGGDEFGGDGGAGFGGEAGFPGGDGGGGGSQSGGIITKFAGDLGAGMVKEFTSRVDRGVFGAVLKDAPQAGRGGGFQGGGDEFGGGGNGAPGGIGPPGGNGGDPGGGDPGGIGGDPGGGDPGGIGGDPGGKGGFGGGFGGGGGIGGGQGAAVSVARGMTILGVGPERELVKKAKEAGVDVLALFEVSVKVNPKTRLITNDTKVVLIDVAKGGRMHTGKLMNNFKVQKARADSKDDGVDKEIEKLFTFIDENLTMNPVPSVLTSEHIKKRVASLVSSKPEDVLPVLTEIRYWHRKNLLDDDGLTAAFSAMLSPSVGEQLANGTEDERKEIVKRWLPAGAN